MSNNGRANFDAVREVAFGGIGAAYAALGDALDDYTRKIGIYNSTNQDVYISFDGVVDHLRIAAGSGQVWDISEDDGPYIPNRTVIYQRHTGAAPASGNLWVQIMNVDGGV